MAPLRELPEDATRITDTIYAVIGRDLDWRVYEEARGGGWHLIDVKPTLRSVRRQYAPDDFEPNPVKPEMYAEWDRVNYAQRMAEQSKDYAAIERAKTEVRRVYNEMQRMSRNSSDSGWTEIGRFDAGWRAFNEMTARQMQSAANIAGRIESMPSRSRPGKISYVVSLKVIDGPKQSLDFLESQYVGPEYEPKNPFQKNSGRRRTSRRAKRTSRRAA